jgi:hypothetical protein
MVDFRDKKRFETKLPLLQVDAGLPAGRYAFQLTVVDSNGNTSKPMRLNVEVVARGRIIDPRLVTPISPLPIQPVGPIRLTPIIRGPN